MALSEMALSLLGEAKNRLGITWDDYNTEQDLIGLLQRGMSYLNKHIGATVNYAEETAAKELLFSYVIYVRSNAFSDFSVNYASEILSLQLYQEIEGYKNDTTL